MNWKSCPLLCSIFLLLPLNDTTACCPAPRPGERVQIADQKILVIWDEENRKEHFIRRADFLGDSEDFAFLVPTPGKPELAEAADAVFDRLEEVTKPVIKTETEYEWKFGFVSVSAMNADKSAIGSLSEARGEAVRVLDRVEVAGFDAVVLESTNARELAKWLEENGYHLRPTITEWLEPYIELNWKITAFKYAPETSMASHTSTAAVRMSFETDEPVFPYRVPTDQLQGERKPPEGAPWELPRENVLRVFFVGPQKVEGSLGAAKQEWPAKLRYAKEHDDLRDLLKESAPMLSLPATGWLTSFDDPTWPGGTEDLFFAATADQAEFLTIITRTVTEEIFIPLDVVLLILVFAVICVVWLAKRKSALKA